VEACPLDAIVMKDGVAGVDESTCSDCGGCVEACPTEAIEMA
jgi:Fe-S-cluster-containing hydrogenase component 2